MGDCLPAGKPSWYVTSQPGGHSLLPSTGWENELSGNKIAKVNVGTDISTTTVRPQLHNTKEN